MSRVSIHMTAKDARHVLWLIQGLVGTETTRARAAIERALKPKRSVTLSRKRAKAKRATRKERFSRIRQDAEMRAGGKCEGCFLPFSDNDPSEADHIFSGNGRRKATERLDAIMMLHRSCHRRRHAEPNAALMSQIAFAERHGYRTTLQALEARAETVRAHVSFFDLMAGLSRSVKDKQGRVSPSLEEKQT